MSFVCMRLPANDDTCAFLSPFLEQENIRAGLDDDVLTPYGMYKLMNDIRTGSLRCYGVFELDDENQAKSFCGTAVGALDHDGTFEVHALFDRKSSAEDCLRLAQEVMRKEYAAEGVAVKYCTGIIPEVRRAAKRLAFRYGGRDCGLHPERVFHKGGSVFRCRVFRIDIQEDK